MHTHVHDTVHEHKSERDRGLSNHVVSRAEVAQIGNVMQGVREIMYAKRKQEKQEITAKKVMCMMIVYACMHLRVCMRMIRAT
jgi:hypothetical protein